MDVSLSELRELVMDSEAWRAAIYGGHKEWDMTEWLIWSDLDSKQSIADSPVFIVLEFLFRTAEEVLNVNFLPLLSQYPPWGNKSHAVDSEVLETSEMHHLNQMFWI